MKLLKKRKYFDMIKNNEKFVEYRDAHITFIAEDNGEKFLNQNKRRLKTFLWSFKEGEKMECFKCKKECPCECFEVNTDYGTINFCSKECYEKSNKECSWDAEFGEFNGHYYNCEFGLKSYYHYWNNKFIKYASHFCCNPLI